MIGVIGGGQLGRMLALAGIPLGHSFRFLDPSADCPAAGLGELFVGDYDNPELLEQFMTGLDAATFEFENVPANTVAAVAERIPTAPNIRSLSVAQDRIHEKEFFSRCGIAVQEFAPVSSEAELASVSARIGFPAVLKTRSMGYDGKGQYVLRSPADLPGAWRAVGGRPSIYEAFVNFTAEVSAIAVRSHDGDFRTWALCLNEHRGGILRKTIAPATGVTKEIEQQAFLAIQSVMNALGYVGVLAMEFFVTNNGLIANEMAPRVHNSGHWTIDGSVTSQFENHLRAVCHEPLGSTDLRGMCAMINIIGVMPDRDDLLAVPGVHLHDYAKSARVGRKLAHVNMCASDARIRDAQTVVVEELVRLAESQAKQSPEFGASERHSLTQR